MKQTLSLARLLIVLLVVAPLASPTAAGATARAESRLTPLVPVSPAQDAADLTIHRAQLPGWRRSRRRSGAAGTSG